MYRDLAPEGAPFGVQRGPYTGPPRRLRVSALPAAVVARLAAALAGSGHPEPLLRGATRRGYLGLAAGGVFLAAAAGVAAATTREFGQIPGFLQGYSWLALYSGLGAITGAGAAGLVVGNRGLPGRGAFLLPLDVVEIDGDGLTLTPLGGLRRATLEHDAGRIALVLRFEHGARHVFSVASEAEAERAFARLEHAQQTLEDLTDQLDLERALDLDPFFSLREEGKWAEIRLSWERVQRSVAVLMVGALLGAGLWKLRNKASDDRAYEHAALLDTREGYLGYRLEGGQLHKNQAEQAIRWLEDLERLRQDPQNELDGEAGEFPVALASQPDLTLSPALQDARRATQQRGLAAFHPRARSGAPGVEPLIETFFEMSRLAGGNELSVEFVRIVEDRARTPGLIAQLDHDEAAVIQALQRSLGEVFAPSVLIVNRAHSPGRRAPLRIDYQLVAASAQDIHFVFHASFGAMLGPPPITFDLTMPRPKEPLRGVRDRSLFTIEPSQPAAAETQAIVARAFDRLYDELYGIFFLGSPRVPLAPLRERRNPPG